MEPIPEETDEASSEDSDESLSADRLYLLV